MAQNYWPEKSCRPRLLQYRHRNRLGDPSEGFAELQIEAFLHPRVTGTGGFPCVHNSGSAPVELGKSAAVSAQSRFTAPPNPQRSLAMSGYNYERLWIVRDRRAGLLVRRGGGQPCAGFHPARSRRQQGFVGVVRRQAARAARIRQHQLIAVRGGGSSADETLWEISGGAFSILHRLRA